MTKLREDIVFDSQGEHCAGWLYRADRAGRRPCVVMAHGLAAVKEMRLDAYAEVFARAGYHVVVFDYRHFGASAGEPRQLLSIRRQHQDWHAAIAYARAQAEVDADRIVVWGTSLSGGHVMAVAAADARIAALIAQVPHTSALRSVLAGGVLHSLRLTGHALFDALCAALGRSPHYLPAGGAPGSLALMTAPEALRYFDLVPAGMAFDERIAARFGLAVATYSPGRYLRRLGMPALVQVGLQDQTTPAAPTMAAARKSRHVQLKTYATGHFEPYFGADFEHFVGDQLAFLESVFGASADA